MDKLTREEQIRLLAYQQATPLAMMDKQRFGVVAAVEDITKIADEIVDYISPPLAEITGIIRNG